CPDAQQEFYRPRPLGPLNLPHQGNPDPTPANVTARPKGEEMQQSRTDQPNHSIPAIIAFCSVFTPLTPGDIIATGTPDGIGAKRNPPVWMTAGDVLEVEISGIGTLRNRIADET